MRWYYKLDIAAFPLLLIRFYPARGMCLRHLLLAIQKRKPFASNFEASVLIMIAYLYTAFDSEIAFAILLGPTDPCSIAVSMEPFSTLALKGLT